MGVTDILNQLPLVFKNYIKTDMDISTIAKPVSYTHLKADSVHHHTGDHRDDGHDHCKRQPDATPYQYFAFSEPAGSASGLC